MKVGNRKYRCRAGEMAQLVITCLPMQAWEPEFRSLADIFFFKRQVYQGASVFPELGTQRQVELTGQTAD